MNKIYRSLGSEDENWAPVDVLPSLLTSIGMEDMKAVYIVIHASGVRYPYHNELDAQHVLAASKCLVFRYLHN